MDKTLTLGMLLLLLSPLGMTAQDSDNSTRPDDGPPPPAEGAPPGGPPPDFDQPPMGPGAGGPRFGGMNAFREVKLLDRFDQDRDGRLNLAERRAAREFLAKQRSTNARPRGPGRWNRDQNQEPLVPGPRLSPAEVQAFSNEPLYEPTVLRTFFLQFESTDWEKELGDFYHTDVEVPAMLIVDGNTYPEVGVHFRGASSFGMVAEGRKRSLNVSLDFVHEDQRLGGYRTLNLLNSHGDPTFLRTVLYYQIAREYIPGPKANFVRVVINGEYWGVYINAQQFNKDMVKEWYETPRGARWKVTGRPNGRGGLTYLGEDVTPYRQVYEIKSKDDAESWAALIKLCRLVHQTPSDQLEAALEPMLDLEGTLKFLALENALINNDGYWIRASDYYLYHDSKGRFHLIPYDANETFAAAGGPGFGGPRGGRGSRLGRGASDQGLGPNFAAAPSGGGVALDPLVAATNADKPLLSKLLAVPSLRTRYLRYVRDIAERWLDWNKLSPLAQQHQAVIADAVKQDTRKLSSFEAFQQGLAGEAPNEDVRGPGQRISLKAFAQQRRAYLLNQLPVNQAAR